MFRKPTVFIIGAGTSLEIGMPLGSGLIDSVGKALRFRFEYGHRQISGDPDLLRVLRSKYGNDVNAYTKAANELVAILPSFKSMDEALHHLSARPEIVELGKLGIVHSILAAERGSNLKIVRDKGRPALAVANGTWYGQFRQMALSASTREEMDHVFDNVTFINFNYDRTLEHYLYWALQSQAGIPRDQAAEVVSRLKVIRPYGKVAPLDWQERGGIAFGGSDYFGDEIYDLIGQIRTFTEQHEAEVPKRVRAAINKSTLVIFAGLGFHAQNMELLDQRPVNQGARQVYATMKGIARENHRLLESQLSTCLRARSVTLVDKSARDLLADLWPTIMAAAS